ncbi:hypothetical protein FIBSPDRAFT_600768 [Athelia psychrophila]|uniref:Uncharacterized protein n=1 Tax=Athelia psychrophila TaxID=1759441 RepID=A0A166GSZ6_9AGAM|nr:hypothetical protein FIBSPDRAFT_600768 [Fibularhizoctonia sp. CBS 109695]
MGLRGNIYSNVRGLGRSRKGCCACQRERMAAWEALPQVCRVRDFSFSASCSARRSDFRRLKLAFACLFISSLDSGLGILVPGRLFAMLEFELVQHRPLVVFLRQRRVCRWHSLSLKILHQHTPGVRVRHAQHVTYAPDGPLARKAPMGKNDMGADITNSIVHSRIHASYVCQRWGRAPR